MDDPTYRVVEAAGLDKMAALAMAGKGDTMNPGNLRIGGTVVLATAAILLGGMWAALRAQPMGPRLGPDPQPDPPQTQPEQPAPGPVDFAAPLAQLAADEPADWRAASERLIAAGEPAIDPLLARMDGADRRLAIRAESVLRRMGLSAIPALHAAGRHDLAHEILQDRVGVMLTGPQLVPQFPADLQPIDPDIRDRTTVVLARGTATRRYDLIEFFRFVPQGGTVLVRGLRFMNTPLQVPEGGKLPADPDQVLVSPMTATMSAARFGAWVETLRLIGGATFRGRSAGPQKGDPIRRAARPDEPVDDREAPLRWFQTRMTLAPEGLPALDAAWVGGEEFTHPDYLRAVAPMRTLSPYLPPAALAETDLTDDDREWLAAEATRLHQRSRWPLEAWVFARAVMMLGHAGNAAALPLLKTVLQDEAAPAQTVWFATQAAVRLLGDKAADAAVPLDPARADEARAAVLKLLE